MATFIRSHCPCSGWPLSKFGFWILILSLSTFTQSGPCLGQSLGTLRMGTPVRIELHSDTTARSSGGDDKILQPSDSRVLEATFLGFYVDHIRIQDPESGETIILTLDEVKELRAMGEGRGRTRAVEGLVVGALLGGGLTHLLLQHNGGRPSCSSDTPSLGSLVCKSSQTAYGLSLAGGIVVGGIIGALLGSSVEVDRDGTVLIPLPDLRVNSLPRVRMGFSISGR